MSASSFRCRSISVVTINIVPSRSANWTGCPDGLRAPRQLSRNPDSRVRRVEIGILSRFCLGIRLPAAAERMASAMKKCAGEYAGATQGGSRANKIGRPGRATYWRIERTADAGGRVRLRYNRYIRPEVGDPAGLRLGLNSISRTGRPGQY